MSKEYIEERSGALYVKGTRVSLASVVLEFREGAAPETILQDFPSSVSLENVYGALTHYLANQGKVEEDLKGPSGKVGGIPEICRSTAAEPYGATRRYSPIDHITRR